MSATNITLVSTEGSRILYKISQFSQFITSSISSLFFFSTTLTITIYVLNLVIVPLRIYIPRTRNRERMFSSPEFALSDDSDREVQNAPWSMLQNGDIFPFKLNVFISGSLELSEVCEFPFETGLYWQVAEP